MIIPLYESGYGIKVEFPCFQVETPWGPVKIGGRCGEEAQIAQQKLEQVPPPSPLAPLVPVVLVGAIAIAGILIFKRKSKKEGA